MAYFGYKDSDDWIEGAFKSITLPLNYKNLLKKSDRMD